MGGKIRTLKGEVHIPGKRRKQKFNPDSEYIQKAIDKYLAEGGTIETIVTPEYASDFSFYNEADDFYLETKNGGKQSY